MKRASSVLLGLALGGVLASIVACSVQPTSMDWKQRSQLHNEISEKWTQIRDWRHGRNWDPDPPSPLLQFVRGKQVREGLKACAVAEPRSCGDVCGLRDSICDNAESICKIADDLGKDDDFAQQKCTSAKASCVEAQQRCCECSTKPIEEAAPL